MHKLAKKDPQMHHLYFGLKTGATSNQEIRAYKVLSYIFNKIFTDAAEKIDINVEILFFTRPRWAWLLMNEMPFCGRRH